MTGFESGIISLDSQAVTLVAGDNNDIPIEGSLLYFIVSDPGAVVTGISLGEGRNFGALVLAVNTGVTGLSYAIANDSSSSAAEARILTADGQDYTVRPFETAILGYDTNGQRWHVIRVPDSPICGTVEMTFESTVRVGWLLLNGGTIGDASSGGTSLATAYALDLFAHLWNNLSDAQAPVSGGRGASAAADFAAHKTITLPDMRQRFPIGLAASGTGSVLGGTGGTIDHNHGSPITTSAPSATIVNLGLLGVSSAATSTHTHTVTLSNQNPPFIALNFIIKI